MRHHYRKPLTQDQTNEIPKVMSEGHSTKNPLDSNKQTNNKHNIPLNNALIPAT